MGIGENIIENITGFEKWCLKWRDWHELRRKGIPGLSGREEKEAIEALRPDKIKQIEAVKHLVAPFKDNYDPDREEEWKNDINK